MSEYLYEIIKDRLKIAVQCRNLYVLVYWIYSSRICEKTTRAKNTNVVQVLCHNEERIMRTIISTITIILLFISTNILAEETGRKKISKIKVSGTDGYYYFVSTDGKWGAPNCKDATYVYIVPADVLDKEAMLSVALSAKMAGKDVWFNGSCDSNNEYFRATALWVE